MLVALVIIVVVTLAAFSALYAGIRGAVPGYQDDWGFHRGAEPRPRSDLSESAAGTDSDTPFGLAGAGVHVTGDRAWKEMGRRNTPVAYHPSV